MTEKVEITIEWNRAKNNDAVLMGKADVPNVGNMKFCISYYGDKWTATHSISSPLGTFETIEKAVAACMAHASLQVFKVQDARRMKELEQAKKDERQAHATAVVAAFLGQPPKVEVEVETECPKCAETERLSELRDELANSDGRFMSLFHQMENATVPALTREYMLEVLRMEEHEEPFVRLMESGLLMDMEMADGVTVYVLP